MKQPTFKDMSTFDIFLKNDKPSSRKRKHNVITIKKVTSVHADNYKPCRY